MSWWSFEKQLFSKKRLQTGIMYGLCKVRKFYLITRDVLPSRPIVSAIDTSKDSLGKFFVSILKEHTINEYTVHFHFVMKYMNKIRLYTWHPLTFIHFLPKSLLTKWLIYNDNSVNRAFQHKKAIKQMLRRHFK